MCNCRLPYFVCEVCAKREEDARKYRTGNWVAAAAPKPTGVVIHVDFKQRRRA